MVQFWTGSSGPRLYRWGKWSAAMWNQKLWWWHQHPGDLAAFQQCPQEWRWLLIEAGSLVKGQSLWMSSNSCEAPAIAPSLSQPGTCGKGLGNRLKLRPPPLTVSGLPPAVFHPIKLLFLFSKGLSTTLSNRNIMWTTNTCNFKFLWNK